MFEWNEAKRLTNLAKHRLDFVDGSKLFDGRARVDVPARTQAEARMLTIGEIEGKIYTLVWTWRLPARRIISFRRARHDEEAKYYALLER